MTATQDIVEVMQPRSADRLTGREVEILGLVSVGRPSPSIGEQLGITHATVKSHLTNIYRKIGANNRVEATRWYLARTEPAPEIDQTPSNTAERAPEQADALAAIRRRIARIERRLKELAEPTAEERDLRALLAALQAAERRRDH